ncbi:MAG: hypothetical protein ABIQ12_03975 [Opitutaceae bacterium]
MTHKSAPERWLFPIPRKTLGARLPHVDHKTYFGESQTVLANDRINHTRYISVTPLFK